MIGITKAKEVAALLEKNGFVKTRQVGSHARFSKGNRHVTIPMHNGDIPKGTLASILRQAGLK